MMDVDEKLKQGIAALKAGRKKQARQLLMQVLEQDEANEQAWLWMSGAVETDEQRRICLEKVLDINPHSDLARRGLARLGEAKREPRAQSPAGPLRPPEAAIQSTGEAEAVTVAQPSTRQPAQDRTAQLLSQARAALEAGDRERGKRLLVDLVEQDEQNEGAWLLLSRCVDDREVRRECLERALRINPASDGATRGLEGLSALPKAQGSSGSSTLSRSRRLVAAVGAGAVLLACFVAVGVWSVVKLGMPHLPLRVAVTSRSTPEPDQASELAIAPTSVTMRAPTAEPTAELFLGSPKGYLPTETDMPQGYRLVVDESGPISFSGGSWEGYQVTYNSVERAMNLDAAAVVLADFVLDSAQEADLVFSLMDSPDEFRQVNGIGQDVVLHSWNANVPSADQTIAYSYHFSAENAWSLPESYAILVFRKKNVYATVVVGGPSSMSDLQVEAEYYSSLVAEKLED